MTYIVLNSRFDLSTLCNRKYVIVAKNKPIDTNLIVFNLIYEENAYDSLVVFFLQR